MAAAKIGFFGKVWKNIKHTRTVTKAIEVHVGTDSQGNKFYERPADQENNIRLQRRIEAADGDTWHAPEVPTEWLAWLRSRRTDPPTQQEIESNTRQRQLIQQRAARLEKDRMDSPEGEERLNLPATEKSSSAFPKYEEFEVHPGEFDEQKYQRK